MMARPILARTVTAILALLLAMAAAAFAQDATPTAAPSPTPPAETPAPADQVVLPGEFAEPAARAERLAAQLRTELDDTRRTVGLPAVSSGELRAARARLEDARGRAISTFDGLAAPLANIDRQLASLGPAPAEGASEPEAIAVQRRALDAARTRLTAARTQLDLMATDAGQLSARASAIERDRFVSEITRQSRPIVSPRLWSDAAAALPDVWTRLSRMLTSTHGQLTDAGGPTAVWFLAAAAAVLAAAGAMAVRALERRLRPAHGSGDLARLARALLLPLGSALVVVAAGTVWALLYQAAGGVSERFLAVYWALIGTLGLYLFARGLATGVLAPGRPDLRIAAVGETAAQRLLTAITVIAATLAVSGVAAAIAGTLFLPASLGAAGRAVAAVVLIVAIARALNAASAPAVADETAPPARYFQWTRYLVQPLWLVLVAVVAALLLGYVALAHYVLVRLVFSGLIVAVLYLVRNLADVAVSASLVPASPVARFLKSRVMLSDRAIERAGIFFSAFVDIAVVLIGAPLLVMSGSFSLADLKSLSNTILFGFKVGDVSINLSTVLAAASVFAVGLILTRVLTTWLDRRVLARTQMDVGVRNSVRTGVSYLAVVVAILVALASAGVDFSNIALIAGALGVGIGFGLQSIVNNFVSGLILLAERPIKVGDWVQVAAGEGTVSRINVRSTEIETFDRCTIVVPNSSLISDAVKNWTHGDIMGRCRVTVTVATGSDPEQVRGILAACAAAHPRALAFPEPSVLFTDIGTTTLSFEVRVFINDVTWVGQVASDLRFAIFKALTEAGIATAPATPAAPAAPAKPRK